MADDEQQDEPSDDASFDDELTPEQREELLKSLTQFRRSLIPKIDLNLQAAQVNALKPYFDTQATSFNILKPILDAQATALKPYFGAQAAWHRQLFINSDIFRTAALHQFNLNLIGSRLTSTIDFGLGDTISRLGTQFATQQLTAIQSALAYIRPASAFYPPNLQDIEDLEFDEVEQVVMVDGIALYGVPRTSTAEALIRADSASKRRAILGRRTKSISADCREVVTAATTPAVAPYMSAAVAALDSLDDGHPRAAQALAGSLIDAIVTAKFKRDRYNYRPDKRGRRSKAAYDKFTVHQFIAFAPMWQTYQRFDVDEGDVIPTTFSRNATAHTVSRRQFHRRNAVQALMFACSLVCRLDDEARNA